MAIELIHRIEIEAPVEKIYRAITTEDGIRAWWTTDVKMDLYAGGAARFGFFQHSTVFTMCIEKLTPPSFVLWKCIESTSPEWIGTTQEFRLEQQSGGEVLLKFSHTGWEAGCEHCYFCNTTWGHLLVCLKQYAEKGIKNPYFT